VKKYAEEAAKLKRSTDDAAFIDIYGTTEKAI
jgi:hypothetical protein